jgi:phosphoglycerate dehydrogenase-like enzyme
VKVAVLDDYQRVALSYPYWSALPADVEVVPFHDHIAAADELAAALEPFDVVVAMRERTPLPAELLARLPRLRLLVTTGMANAAIDLAAARSQGITVCGTAAVGSSTAELTWALLLAVARGVPAADASLRSGVWQAGSTPGGDLSGATLGVLGLGRLGSAVSAVALAFGMRVVAWSANLTAERVAEVGAELVTKKELLSTSDIVTVHLRLSERTRGLIGAPELALMRPSAYLVNTSRGPIVDQAALIDALSSGGIAGAGLDVYDEEPLPPGHPLLTAPNTVLTPHLGYVSRGTFDLFHREIVEDIAAFHAGQPVRML